MLQPSAQNNSVLHKGFLRKRADFLKTYKGRFVRQDYFVLYVRRNEVLGHRFGVTAPKTIGTAVVRNRFKRWSKEVYRKINLNGIETPLDINIFFGSKRLKKEDFKNVQFRDFEKQVKESLQSLLRNFK